MFYHLFTYLDRKFDIPGAGLFNYISFRAAMAAILSLIIALVIAIISVKLVLWLFKISFIFISFFSTMVFLGMIVIFTLPLFVIIKKKLLN